MRQCPVANAQFRQLLHHESELLRLVPSAVRDTERADGRLGDGQRLRRAAAVHEVHEVRHVRLLDPRDLRVYRSRLHSFITINTQTHEQRRQFLLSQAP